MAAVLAYMHSNQPTVSPLPRISRVVATLAAALVMVLSLATVSPELHAWLHDRGEDRAAQACPHRHAAESATPVADSSGHGESHECAVTLFSQGVVHYAAALLTQPCEGVLRAVNFRAFERRALAQPRYLHRPPQAPPAV